MDELLKLLRQNALETPKNLARMLNMDEAAVKAKIRDYEASGVIRGYQAIVNEESLGLNVVHAVIEVKITPERDGGFNRIAERVGRFPEVDALYLMSGTYDLLLFVTGHDLRQVASFVSEKLATLQGVISTTTHFMLKTYKEDGVLMRPEQNDERLKVSP